MMTAEPYSHGIREQNKPDCLQGQDAGGEEKGHEHLDQNQIKQEQYLDQEHLDPGHLDQLREGLQDLGFLVEVVIP